MLMWHMDWEEPCVQTSHVWRPAALCCLHSCWILFSVATTVFVARIPSFNLCSILIAIQAGRPSVLYLAVRSHSHTQGTEWDRQEGSVIQLVNSSRNCCALASTVMEVHDPCLILCRTAILLNWWLPVLRFFRISRIHAYLFYSFRVFWGSQTVNIIQYCFCNVWNSVKLLKHEVLIAEPWSVKPSILDLIMGILGSMSQLEEGTSES